MKSLLNIEDLYVNAEDKEILKGLNLNIKKGEIHVIMGPNGAGKSTLANVILNNPEYKKISGNIYFEDENINELSTDKIAKKGIFMSFQSPEEVPGISTMNFLKVAKNKIEDKPVKIFEFKETVKKYMEELNMNSKLINRNLNVGFSGGEKKKNEILQMLVLNPKLAILDETSKQKNDPDWMRKIRLKALETYEKLELPTWGPDLSDLKMDEIATYVKPKSKLNSNWNDVPEDIKNTFDKLGIPEAEKKSLSGVGAQYDSEVVYHSIKQDLLKQGVIYTDMETAVKEYPEIVKEHFMKCVPINDHKFVALHAAVWSGGSFVYVPKNVKVDIPLQSYFRLNSPESGQFEHTLIIVDEGASLHFIEGCSAPKYNKVNLHAGCVELYVKDNAYLRYSTIENWSKNMMNLNTKKAIVGKNAQIDWVTGSFGSKVSMLYPMSILNGENAKTEYTGITFAGKGQNLDTGFKVIHNAPNTSSLVNSKSISKDGGACTYRALVRITENAKNAKCSVSCESLMLDDISKSDTIPVNDIRTDEVTFSHEAKIGKVSDKEIFYLMSRGLSEEDAKAMIVRGFAYPISKELPVEYAVEMNNLINLELEGSIG